jgi:hypothetical protein
MVRADVVFALGRSDDTAVLGSITTERTPWWANSRAVASPTGPPPAIRTGTSGTAERDDDVISAPSLNPDKPHRSLVCLSQ